MSAMVDVNTLNADELYALAHLRREAERREAEERAARVLDVLDRPALGHYRKAARS